MKVQIPDLRSVVPGIVARSASPRGEVVLRRRDGDGHLELRVNGVFVMDTLETASERGLAACAIETVGARGGRAAGLRVLVGGLGLGFTLVELASSPLVGEIVVAEVEPALVAWHRSGLVPHTVEALGAPHVAILARDVHDVVVERAAGTLEVIILDVDNGPGFLVYDDNVGLYEPAFLARCRAALAEPGVIVVWSASEAPELEATLAATFGSVAHRTTDVALGNHPNSYHTYLAPAPPGEDQ